MSEIRAVVTMRFDPKDISEVLNTVAPLVEKARSQEPDVLDLTYYANSAAGQLIVFERYRDVAGMIAHVLDMDAETITRLTTLTSFESMSVCGRVNDQLQTILSGFGSDVIYLDELVPTSVA